MKGFCILLLVFAFVVVNTNAWEGRLVSDPDTDKLGHCSLARVKLIGVMQLNETKRIDGQCAVAVCQEDRSIQIIGCPVHGNVAPCKDVPGDLSKPHPECCNEIVCPEKKH